MKRIVGLVALVASFSMGFSCGVTGGESMKEGDWTTLEQEVAASQGRCVQQQIVGERECVTKDEIEVRASKTCGALGKKVSGVRASNNTCRYENGRPLVNNVEVVCCDRQGQPRPPTSSEQCSSITIADQKECISKDEADARVVKACLGVGKKVKEYLQAKNTCEQAVGNLRILCCDVQVQPSP
jgi:hypothetical protein